MGVCDLKKAKKHVGYDACKPPIDSWISPLAAPSKQERGVAVVLDTSLGMYSNPTTVVWTISSMTDHVYQNPA
jgi:hypothetical protein